MRMNLNPRQIELLEEIRRQGSSTVEALAERFSVTLQTIRRDLQRLEEASLVQRFHGGVHAPGRTTENLAHLQRQSLMSVEKKRIAEAIAADVPPGSALILNIGTTVEAVAQALIHHRGLRVFTNNLKVAMILSANPDCEITVAGGLMRNRDHALVDAAAADFFAGLRVDLAIVGISGIDKEGVLCDYDAREVRVSQAILAHARAVWLAADQTKFGRPALATVAHLSAVHRLYTDHVPAHFESVIHSAGIEVRQV